MERLSPIPPSPSRKSLSGGDGQLARASARTLLVFLSRVKRDCIFFVVNTSILCGVGG
jgi:hypothetical protein